MWTACFGGVKTWFWALLSAWIACGDDSTGLLNEDSLTREEALALI